MVHNICDTAKVARPDLVMLDLAYLEVPWYAASAELLDGHTAVAIAPDFLEYFKDAPDEAYGVLAHEIGHIVAGHVVNKGLVKRLQAAAAEDPQYGEMRVLWESEYEADDFVKKVGMVKGFVKALYRIAKMDQRVIDDSPDHPSIPRRVRRLL